MSAESGDSRGGGGGGGPRDSRGHPLRSAPGGGGGGGGAQGEAGASSSFGTTGNGPAGPNPGQQPPPDFGSSWRSNALAGGGNNPLAAGMAEAAFNNYYFSGGYSPFSGDIRESIAAIWSRTSPSAAGEGVSAPFSGGYGQFSDSTSQFAANSTPTGQFAANLTGHFAGSEMSMFGAGGDFPAAAAAAAYGQQYGYGPQYSQWPDSGNNSANSAVANSGNIPRNGSANLPNVAGDGVVVSGSAASGYNYLSGEGGGNRDRMSNLGQNMDNMKLNNGMSSATSVKRGGESNGYSSAVSSTSGAGSSSVGVGNASAGGQPKKMSWASVASQPAKPVTLAPKAKKPGVLPPPAMIPSAKPLNPIQQVPIDDAQGHLAPEEVVGNQQGAVGSPAPPTIAEAREQHPPVEMPLHQTHQPPPNFAMNKSMSPYGVMRGGQEGMHPQQHAVDQSREPMLARSHGVSGGGVGGNVPPGSTQGPRAARQSAINGRGGGGGGVGGHYAGNGSNRSSHEVNQYVGPSDVGMHASPGGFNSGHYNSKPHPILESLKSQNEYNPRNFDMNPKNARFFVIKSFSEDDIHRSIKYEIWCSTDHGNKRLDAAFKERISKGPIYLFFSVNGSGHFCGIAQMLTGVDYNSTGQSVWVQDKFKGQFKVKWIYVKDVPNGQLRHIRLENNENKPVTNSRDTQEVPPEKGKMVLKIIHGYKHQTSIFDDFIHYEKRQEEEDCKKQTSSGGGGGGHYGNSDRGNDGHRGDSGRHGGKFRGHPNQGPRR